MKSKQLYYILFPIIILILGIIVASCGGGSDNIVSPNLNQSPTLITKDVSGYIYYIKTLA